MTFYHSNVGIGTTTPTAVLQLKAGTATAGTAPLKLTSGVNLATTEAGAIEYDGTHLYFTAANAGTRYQLDQQSSGVTANLLFTPDNTYDIGASAANRPKNLFVAGTGTFGSTLSVTSGQAIGWNGRSFMNSNADGLIVIWNNAQNDFSRLQFGGTTNLFPSIKRNLTALNFRLADDSADASITALNGTFSGTVRQAGATNCGLSANASGDIICTSDINLKQNSRPFTSGLNAILALNPEYFQYKGESYTHAGFIAQNVQAVIPEATPLQGNGFLGLDTNAILAASVNAIKELDTKVTDLQANALGSASKPTGMTVYDKQGQVGCLEVDDVNTGTTSVRPGACITQTTTVVTPSPVPIPEPAPIGTPEPVPIPEPTPLTTPEPVPTPEPVTVPEPVPAPVLPPEQNAVTTPAPSLPETGSAPLRKNNLSGIIIFASIAALAAALSSTLYKIHAEKSHKQKEK
jgi:outer membrane biosynthesis protein TonB